MPDEKGGTTVTPDRKSPAATSLETHEEAALKANVSTALAVAGGLDAFHIDVTVERDQIILTGTVAATSEIASAMIVAQTTASDHAVRHQLVVAQQPDGDRSINRQTVRRGM
jgi:osmotically-inducible protein OsmY